MEFFAFGFFCLFLHEAVGSSDDNLVDLKITSGLEAQCYSQVALHCNISSQDELSIDNLTWTDVHKREELCAVHNSKLKSPTKHGIKCDYVARESLTLTFKHIWPIHEGRYMCKLVSSHGIKQASTTVKLKDCYTDVHHNSSEVGATCHFAGVYPLGEVHWFHDDRNVTADTMRHTVKANHDGTFNVSSSLHMGEKTNKYMCALWIPSSKAYLAKQHVPVTDSVKSRVEIGVAPVHSLGLGFGLMLTSLLVP